jgi:putative Mg2+ transporter-C (MgtC) family protein
MNQHLELLLRLGSAAFCGAVLGLNRSSKQKPAGLRTHALVALGAAYAAWMVLTLNGDDPTAISRIMQGAMTGVGFLGAGVIMRNEAAGRVEGLTTAASIWMATILGLGCGAGLYVDSAITMLIVLLVLLISARMQARVMAILRPGRRSPVRRTERNS